MQKLGQFFFILLISLVNFTAHAQKLTGSWEGKMGDEVLQINIEQKNGALCGYTHDHKIYNLSDNCSTKFNATYLFEEGKWYLQGYEFIARSQNHVFMNIKIWFEPTDPQGVLRASVNSSDINLRMHDYFATEILLRKKANKPVPYKGQMGSCFDNKTEQTDPERPLTTVPPKKTEVPKTPSQPTVPLKKDSTKNKLEPVDSSQAKVKKMEARKNAEQSRLVINSKNLNLKLYDNGVVDGDIISVFYNGKLLVSNQHLSAKPIELNIILDEKIKIHEITLYAENLGEISPNTALIIVTAGKQRFELRSKANLEENAVLVFEYVPQ